MPGIEPEARETAGNKTDLSQNSSSVRETDDENASSL